jgi:hypothetical protein
MTIRTPEDEVTKDGWFTPPFKEGRTYQGITYPGHSDFSVDWNRRTPAGGWLDDTGDPVLAVAPGTVSEVDKAEGLVMVDHAGGYRTEYRHMTDIPVKVGQKVQRSDRLGSVGNVAGSGASFGAHLHHVHWRHGRRIKQSFEGVDIATSVFDSDTRPESWDPPDPVYVQGPPPRATWESAYREAAKALDKVTTQRDAAQAQRALATEERDTARAVSHDAVERLAACTTAHDVTKAALAACEARPPADCNDETDRALVAEQKLDDIRAVLAR